MTDFTLTDYDDNPIEVGTKVRLWDYNESHPEWGQDEKYNGVVLDLGEWDGDVDSEGRNIGIAPRVKVRWDSGGEDYWPTSEWEYDTGYYRDPVSGKVEELVVVS